jgi:hypothetical protein
MSQDKTIRREYLKGFEFKKLFNELGWDHNRQQFTEAVGGQTYTLSGIAEKRGVQILHCLPDSSGKIPEYSVRRKLDRLAAKHAHEHLIIYTDAKKTTQIWQWASKQPGKAIAYRELQYARHQSGEALLQKLEQITFPITEEEGLSLLGVTVRLRDAFDKERLTKKFYTRYEKEHNAFLSFIEGVPDEEMQRWYASVMINRLMFIYFIQAKGFMGDDRYLQHHLEQSHGAFYKEFLCPLFFEGFAQRERERTPETKALLGRVPYLNGGLFTKHQIEEHCGAAIDIGDSAFKALFAFFDSYHWHLDDRPISSGTEINPDVLGYIFEKYVNQKQMGAYYTKEDITEYISKNTILPFLFDKTRKDCSVAFDGAHSLWHLLQEDPDRYIYPAVKHGVDLPLPSKISRGLIDVSQRGDWNQTAPANYALPTEIWRELVARRQRYEDIRSKLASGDVRDINDLITYNLNIRQFAQDCLEQWEGADFLQAFWDAIRQITILDPTCGSGAFLFAALGILEPLYEACLDRMAAFVADANQLGRQKDHPHFCSILDEVAKHPNREYFVFKSIIISNLFGVDIMEEATEICKLRLFLKLAAQVEADPEKENLGIEPLPDIDFNVRAGNTLVGFATAVDTERAVNSKLDFNDAWTAIESKAAAAAKLFEDFQKSQSDSSTSSEYAALMKLGLRGKQQGLRDELDSYLAPQYAFENEESLKAWRKAVQPFHWFIEFYTVMKSGGFDAVIGNPPYVVYEPAKIGYTIDAGGYTTFATKNLYALTFERSLAVAKSSASVGLIVQLTSMSSEKLCTFQDMLLGRGGLFALPFPRRPESMFDGVEMPVAILISNPTALRSFVTSRVGRLYTEERPHTLKTVCLVNHAVRMDGHRIAKIGSPFEKTIHSKMITHKKTVEYLLLRRSSHIVYYQEACRYWVKACQGLPFFRRNGTLMSPPHGRVIYAVSHEASAFLTCVLNSGLFYWYYSVFSDCEHINDTLLRGLPIKMKWEDPSWNTLAQDLMISLSSSAVRKTIYTKQGHTIEYDEISAAQSKPIIDRIDRVLANHYGLSDDEADYIINYDIKFRMGRGGEEPDNV